MAEDPIVELQDRLDNLDTEVMAGRREVIVPDADAITALSDRVDALEAQLQDSGVNTDPLTEEQKQYIALRDRLEFLESRLERLTAADSPVTP